MTKYHAKMPGTFGAMRSKMPDYLYALKGGRHIYTSPWINEDSLRRCSASISLTVNGELFEIAIGGRVQLLQAGAIKPMTERGLRAHGVSMIGFQFDPSHPLFPRFRRIPSPGLLVLNRSLFTQFDAQFDAAYRGAMNINQAEELFDQVTAVALPCFPRATAIDKRIEKSIELLWKNYNMPLIELASAVNVSYYRLSHLFSENMGISLRSYQQWRKVRRAISLSKNNKYTLAEMALAAGFTDAAHFSRAFSQLHAAPPSYFLQSGNVKIVNDMTTLLDQSLAR